MNNSENNSSPAMDLVEILSRLGYSINAGHFAGHKGIVYTCTNLDIPAKENTRILAIGSSLSQRGVNAAIESIGLAYYEVIKEYKAKIELEGKVSIAGLKAFACGASKPNDFKQVTIFEAMEVPEVKKEMEEAKKNRGNNIVFENLGSVNKAKAEVRANSL